MAQLKEQKEKELKPQDIARNAFYEAVEALEVEDFEAVEKTADGFIFTGPEFDVAVKVIVKKARVTAQSFVSSGLSTRDLHSPSSSDRIGQSVSVNAV